MFHAEIIVLIDIHKHFLNVYGEKTVDVILGGSNAFYDNNSDVYDIYKPFISYKNAWQIVLSMER